MNILGYQPTYTSKTKKKKIEVHLLVGGRSVASFESDFRGGVDEK